MKYLFYKAYDGRNEFLRCKCGRKRNMYTRYYYCENCFQSVFYMNSNIIFKDIRKDSVFIEREDLEVYEALEKL